MASALKDITRTLGIVTLLAAGFTWFGVYGTGGPVWLRFAMWFVTMMVGAISSFWIVPFVFHRHLKTAHPAIRILAASILLAVPVTLTLEVFLFLIGANAALPYLPIQFAYVWAVCLVMTIGGFLMDRARRLAELEDAEPEDRVAGFLQRLPVKYRGADLWAISSEDHYLRVHTDRGEEMILMRPSRRDPRTRRRQWATDAPLLVGVASGRQRCAPRQWQAGPCPEIGPRSSRVAHLSARRPRRRARLALAAVA